MPPEATEVPNAPDVVRQIGRSAYARLAQGNPNSGFIVGSEAVLVVDTAPTPAMARVQLDRIREVTDKPIRYVLLTHYHAVRVLGAALYANLGAEVIASNATRELIDERGAEDMRSEMERFPQLFKEPHTIEGLVHPTRTFDRMLRVSLGSVDVDLIHFGRGHTRGDSIAWLPDERICFSGDLVEQRVGVYAGDAHIRDWLITLERLRSLEPSRLVPGRGVALMTRDEVGSAIDYTRDWLTALWEAVSHGKSLGLGLEAIHRLTKDRMDPVFGSVFLYEHCVAFDVARAIDEVDGKDPAIWTSEEDRRIRQRLMAI